MPTIQEIANALAQLAPPPIAESYDNVGLLVGYPQVEATGVLINLDVTEEVLAEAKALGINLIVTHHPIWFMARKKLNGEDYVSRIIMSAIKNDIALYACHTNLDNVRNGVNLKIAEKLGLQNIRFLSEKVVQNEVYGSGMIGEWDTALSTNEFLAKVSETFHCQGIRYSGNTKKAIQKVAVCGGAGSFLISQALQKQADALVTADVTYHKFFDAEDKLLLLDIGHYESEQFTSELIFAYLSEKFTNFALYLSKVHTNPVKYFCPLP
ncbi:MAG: Nif3-like dinuclear metal center hexameric protein [Bacteroidia bacterium]